MRVVVSALSRLQLCGNVVGDDQFTAIELGGELSEPAQEALRTALRGSGMTVLAGERPHLAEEVRKALNEYVNSFDERTRITVRDAVVKALPFSYEYLSRVFSQELGCTIEQYVIRGKIDRVKELLLSGLSLTEISYRLQYSSVAHLSTQFKKVTGNTPTVFKLQRMRLETSMAMSAILCKIMFIAYNMAVR